MRTIEIFIALLNPDQMRQAMKEMEKDAQEKLFFVQTFYETSVESMSESDMENLSELIENASWEQFLPEEYGTLKEMLNVKKEAS